MVARRLGKRGAETPPRTQPRLARSGSIAALVLAAACLPVMALAQIAPPVRWQAGWTEYDLSVSPDSLRRTLHSGWIRPETFRLSLGDTILVRGVDFLLDPAAGTLRLLRPVPAGTHLHLAYRSFPLALRPEFRRHQAGVGLPSRSAMGGRSGDDRVGIGRADTVSSLGRTHWPGLDAERETSLDISGSKTFSVEVGTNRDLALKQSLDLLVNGRLGRDVRVKAILSDRNTPLQPEGTSTQLEDLDRILVQVEGPTARMTLGDFELVLPRGEFLSYRRQLEGAQGELTPRRGQLFLTGATSPGTSLSRSFLGTEGKQGPYLLQQPSASGVGVIVAGSERVSLDGKPLTRGEGEDYIIDYSEGTLTFTGRHPITAYSEITVDFQYATEQYRRAVYGGGVRLGRETEPSPALSGGTIRSAAAGGGDSWARAVFLNEGDDRSKSVVPLTDAQRAALRAAGDSVTADLRSGIIFLGFGQGDYERVQVDTLPNPFFRYTGAGLGSYQVRFEDVGESKGDYGVDTVSHPGLAIYAYIGRRKGRYLPGEAVPRPENARLISLSAAPPLCSWMHLGGELGLSDYDPNTFSALDDGDNSGTAFLVENALGPFPVGPVRIRLGARVRSIDAGFHSLDRLNPSTFSKDWNVDDSRLQQGDRRRALSGGFDVRRVSLRVEAEDLDNLRDFRGTRTTWATEGTEAGVEVRGRLLRAHTRDTSTGIRRPGGRWTEFLSLRRPGSLVVVSTSYSRERNFNGEGEEQAGGLFKQGSVGLGSGSRWDKLRTAVEWTRRVRWELSGGRSKKLDTGDTGLWNLDWQGGGGRLVSLGYSLRNLKPEGEGGAQKSRQGRVRWLERVGDDAFVQEGRAELSTAERGSRTKEVRFVGEGQGHYDSLGVYQGIGGYEVFYRDLTDSARVNRVDFSLRHELDLSRFLGQAATEDVGAAVGEAGAAQSLPLRFWRSLRLAHNWTARLEFPQPVSYLWPRIVPSLVGTKALPLSEVQMRVDLSALPSVRWFSPRLRFEMRRHNQSTDVNASDASSSTLAAARFFSRPAQRWTTDQELEWEKTVSEISIIEAGARRDGWRSLRLRVNLSAGLRKGLTFGLETSSRLRDRIGAPESARVLEGSPFLVWLPQSRSRVELRTTRTSVARTGGIGLASRALERPGWSSRLLANVRLREELDLSFWLRDQRPDRGRAVQDGRMELRATF
jgi:hypothetical protein